MKMKIYVVILLAIMSFLLVSATGGQSQDEAILRKRAGAYADAFNRQDVDTLTKFYADDVVYRGIFTGTTLEGKEAIANGLQALFQSGKKPRLELQVESITFPDKDQAVERGIAVLTSPDGQRFESDYNVFYAKKEGGWLITRVSDAERPSSQYEHLKGLEWLVGNWIDEDDEAAIEMTTDWDRQKNFLVQQFRVLAEDRLQLEVRQRIAWDPIQKNIRSWIFDSDGGFGEGSWVKKGDSWVVNQVFTLADGSKASAVNIYSKIGKDSYTWTSTGREVGGEILPDVGPIEIVRKNG